MNISEETEEIKHSPSTLTCCKGSKPCPTVSLFMLRFYGPVNLMGSCRARSVYLTTRLLGRLSPQSS